MCFEGRPEPRMKNSLKGTWCFAVLWLLYGCAISPSSPSRAGGAIQDLRAIPPATVKSLLICGQAGGYSGLKRPKKIVNPTVIRDRDFVQRTFQELQKADLVASVDLMFIPGRPVVFLDEHGEVICGFLYFAVSKPANAFKRHEAFKRSDGYYFGPQLDFGTEIVRDQHGNVSFVDSRCVPHFKDDVSKYFDAYR